jgi:hypothetical protein
MWPFEPADEVAFYGCYLAFYRQDLEVATRTPGIGYFIPAAKA